MKAHACCHCGHTFSTDVLEARLGGACPRCVVTFAYGPAPRPAPTADWPHLADYELLEVLGQGGMGVVFRAFHPPLEREVAVKLVRPERADDAAFLERFRREARLQASLDHPGIARVLDFGVVDRRPFLVMDVIDGPSLRAVIDGGPLPGDLALDLARQLAETLAHAHDEGLIHRDLKPENLLMDGDRLVVVDFGLARQLDSQSMLTAEGALVGTPLYMAPEQLAGLPADERTDIYALGVILHEMLTGALPMGHYQAPSVSSDVSTQVDAIVARALSRDPDARQQTAAALRDELDAALARHGLPGPPPAPVTPPSAWWTALGAAALLGVAWCFGTFAHHYVIEMPRYERIASDSLAPLPGVSHGVLDIGKWLISGGAERGWSGWLAPGYALAWLALLAAACRPSSRRRAAVAALVLLAPALWLYVLADSSRRYGQLSVELPGRQIHRPANMRLLTREYVRRDDQWKTVDGRQVHRRMLVLTVREQGLPGHFGRSRIEQVNRRLRASNAIILGSTAEGQIWVLVAARDQDQIRATIAADAKAFSAAEYFERPAAGSGR